MGELNIIYGDSYVRHIPPVCPNCKNIIKYIMTNGLL